MAKRAQLSLEIDGDESLIIKLESLATEATAPVRQVIEWGAIRIHGSAVRKLTRGPATGRVYEKYEPRRTHQASAPGEAPMSDTGSLVALTRWRIEKNGLSAVVESLAEYGRWLEFGTKDGRIKARPWLFPSYEENRKGILKKLRTALKKVFKRAVRGVGVKGTTTTAEG
jgi:hypothetical protein